MPSKKQTIERAKTKATRELVKDLRMDIIYALRTEGYMYKVIGKVVGLSAFRAREIMIEKEKQDAKYR
jgi:hypothetical protein